MENLGWIYVYLKCCGRTESQLRKLAIHAAPQYRFFEEEKRRIYNDLLAKDKKGVAEVAENNKKIQKLMV